MFKDDHNVLANHPEALSASSLVAQTPDNLFRREADDPQPFRPVHATKTTDCTPLIDISETDRATDQSRYRFELIGKTWYVNFEDEYATLSTDRGMQYIHLLLSRSNRAIPAEVLVGHQRRRPVAQGSVVSQNKVEEQEEDVGDSYHTILDEDAISAYQNETARLADAIEKARDAGDDTKVKAFMREFELIEHQLHAARTHRGKPRRLGPPPETVRAAESVRKALKRAYKKMADSSQTLPKLVKHLKKNIQREGTDFAYRVSAIPPWKL